RALTSGRSTARPPHTLHRPLDRAARDGRNGNLHGVKPAICTARSRMACLFAAGLALSACTAGTTTSVVDHRSRVPDAVPAPAPLAFGRHRYGERVEKTIRIFNTTSHPIAFRDPKFDCGCFFLLSPPPKMRLDAGESVSFVVLMDSTHAYPGRFHKTMTVVVD